MQNPCCAGGRRISGLKSCFASPFSINYGYKDPRSMETTSHFHLCTILLKFKEYKYYLHPCCPTRAVQSSRSRALMLLQLPLPACRRWASYGTSSTCEEGRREGGKEGSAERKREERDEICISFGRSVGERRRSTFSSSRPFIREILRAREARARRTDGRTAPRGERRREERRYCARTRPRWSPRERMPRSAGQTLLLAGRRRKPTPSDKKCKVR